MGKQPNNPGDKSDIRSAGNPGYNPSQPNPGDADDRIRKPDRQDPEVAGDEVEEEEEE